MWTNIRNIMKNTLISPKKIIYFIYTGIINNIIFIGIVLQVFSDNVINVKILFIFSKYNLYLYKYKLYFYINNLYL